jgi:hypothetical protein
VADPKYFKRIWKVQIEDIVFDALDVEFEIKKSLRSEPNSCELLVYGLSEASRKSIESLNIYDPKRTKGEKRTTRVKKTPGRAPKTGKIRVEIHAGYEDTGLSLLFRGDLRRGVSKVDRPEVVFEIQGEDGGTAFLESRINESFPAGTHKVTVVRACAEALGLGLGNLRTVESALQGQYTHGTSASGPASSVLAGVLRGSRVTYSIQNGTLQFVQAGGGLSTIAIDLRQDTGLIGTPELDASGAVIAETLMIPDVAPGAYVQLTSKAFKGLYYVKEVVTKGDSSGGDWGHRLEMYPG